MIIAVLSYLKKRFEAFATGDQTQVERRVQFAEPVSRRTYNMQASDYT